MAGSIPKSFIDELTEKVDIIDVISARVDVKKLGQHHKACCPFHNEKTPSFIIYDDHYHCFGCGAHGDAINFLMEYERLEFVEAIEQLAGSLALEIPYEKDSNYNPEQAKQRKKQLESLYDVVEYCAKYYYQNLANQQSPEAINYLKNRGLSGSIAKTYQLGFALDDRHALIENAEKENINIDTLNSIGMVSTNDRNQQYDRFRNRIMFPIRDHRGHHIGFGGRVLDNSKPKYLNSPETVLFKKNEILYGLYEARKTGNKFDWALVTEGYMDVIALAQFGITQTVATLGTATSETHIRRLFRYVNEITFCFDGDNAGKAAAAKALTPCFKAWQDGKQVSFFFLPNGEDPDSLVRKLGKEDFLLELKEQKLSLDDYFFRHLSDGLNLQNNTDKTQLIKACQPYFKELPEGIFYDTLLQQLSQICALDIAIIDKHLNQLNNEKKPAYPTTRQSIQPTRSASDTPFEYDRDIEPSIASGAPIVQKISPNLITRMIQILLKSPEIAKQYQLPDDEALAHYQYYEILKAAMDEIRGIANIKAHTLFIKLKNHPLEAAFMQIAQLPQPIHSLNDDALENEFKDGIRHIEKSHLSSQLNLAKNEGDMQKVVELKKQLENWN